MTLSIHSMDFWCVTLCGLVDWSQRVLKMETAVSSETMVAVHQGSRPDTPEHRLANVTIPTRDSAGFFAD
jgi:hypothetical protein